MGIQERKEREKQELRNLILSTAAELFRMKGYEKTSMRAIAKAIEYSPGTIYRYFKDKDELLYEVSVRGFQLFFEYLSSVREIKDPMEQLRKLGEVYIQFALDYPSYYDLMFIMNDPMRSIKEKESWKEGETSHGVLTNIIRECQEVGYFSGYDINELSLMIWGQVHGIVSLHLRDRMHMYQESDPQKLMNNAVSIFKDAISKL
ncbi:TetR/AcrR family transcriptional regulator [Aliifodinibius sp. S!AR15-10]|uniref:TetR/AcrR family transcriptional regulator n=1 Tax=Aliifodinibius sp. S!AR15-10 TaxID=2950437 RepID=UPI0028575E22|nr:TetR/AcrR family transcriptional regulator [Aliifodinibius sp. S!AR15-10]MDR8393995.1 TetR/AcrR family transcriptional regulator [Aliifodinibius sp. S!AR15-10]